MPPGKGFSQIIGNHLDANASMLYTTVATGKMPPAPRAKLSDREIEAIRTWLANGARENEDEHSTPPPVIDIPTDRPPINDD